VSGDHRCRSGSSTQVREGRIDTVIAQTDLEHLDAAPGFERPAMSGILVRAVLDRYRLAHQVGDLLDLRAR